MSVNTHKFDGKAGVYESFRPSYPVAFIDYLYNEKGFSPRSVIADIGAGTGKLTRLLLARGSTVYAVEPGDDMRAAAKSAIGENARFIPVAAPAEATTLMDKSIDFVTVAQAFHWFDAAAFRAECARILKPDGLVTLVWNHRVDAPAVREFDALNRELCDNYKGFSGGSKAKHGDYGGFFAGGCDYREFSYSESMDEQAYVGRCLSGSYAPKPADKSYDAYVEGVRAIFARHSERGALASPLLTRSYTGRVTP